MSPQLAALPFKLNGMAERFLIREQSGLSYSLPRSERGPAVFPTHQKII